ncbi:hypothetical protein [Methanobacterium aggregans]|uniref:hypothetical protein n=1 Tax=Methanobacterium aggregans TaxID=1615586 RepID=UPI001AE75552|nr:hypothetical protein [Methanobacterium aggregans]MBP2044884.1 hypothetical protein [Methanobacterium aggregans]
MKHLDLDHLHNLQKHGGNTIELDELEPALNLMIQGCTQVSICNNYVQHILKDIQGQYVDDDL